MNNAEVLIKFKGEDQNVEKTVKGLSSKISGFAKGLGIATAAAATAAAGAISSITKNAISEFAEYEQLLGGVQTLFGTGLASSAEEYAKQVGKSVDEIKGEYEELDKAQEMVTVNAAEAYKTAGISMNDYMNTVTSFAASLKQSISDPVKLAEAADQAVIDMADNANKMGTSMEAIQNAYQGFAKQNYTMLDNLKLGYGGTKTEMERLLADATKISGVKYDISSLGDVYQAIHVIQTELGITGTTALEASTTISGSLNRTKSAFKNFLSSLASGEGVEDSFKNLTESVMVFGKNIMPVIQTVITTVGGMIPEVVNSIVPILPGLFTNLLPPLIDGAVGLVNGLIQALPILIQTLLPSLLNGMVMITKQIITLLPELVLMIANMLPTLIPMIIEAILEIIPMLIENLPLFLKAGFQLISGLAEGILRAIPSVLNLLPKLASSIFDYFKKLPATMREIGGLLLKGLWNGIKDISSWVINKIKGLGSSIINAVKGIFGIHSPSKEFAIIGEYNMLGLEKGMEDMQPEIQKEINGMFDLSPSMVGNMNNSLSPIVNVYNNVNVEQDPLGQVVNNIKTFSGGSKNDYSYGGVY